MENYGIVYLMGSSNIPGIFKIGKVEESRFEKRMRTFRKRGYNFVELRPIFAISVKDYSAAEYHLHSKFSDHRIGYRNSEIFNFSKKDVLELVLEEFSKLKQQDGSRIIFDEKSGKDERGISNFWKVDFDFGFSDKDMEEE